MNGLIKTGFTLIEIMIVIAIIGLLSVVLIPKALPLKNAAKNNVVEANVYILRSFLENRAGADKRSIVALLGTENDTDFTANALKPIKDDIGLKMNTTFSGSSAVKNPFNNTTVINSTNPNIQNNDPENSSVVIGYDTTSIPLNISDITSTITTPGVIAIIVYKTGYVIYGIDNFGAMMQPTLVNMPSRVAQLPIITNPPIPTIPTTPTPPTSPTTTAILNNIGRVYDFLAIDAAEKIIIGGETSNVYSELQSPLFGELNGYFKWNSSPNSASYNAIENPVIMGNNQVIGNVWNSSTAMGTKYSVLVCGNVDFADVDFSYYKGAVVVYVMSTYPVGYCIYGIDDTGNKVGEKKLTLPALMNSTTENNLSNNVKLVSDYLQTRIISHKATCGTDFYNFVQNILEKELKSYYKGANALMNAYVNNWNEVLYTTSTWLDSGNSILLTRNISSGFKSFKGTTIINALSGNNNILVGYEVYGINYNGDVIGYRKIQ